MSEIDLSALTPDQRERWRARLDHLPPGIRESLLKNLARVPPDRVAKILAENEPMLARLEQKLKGAVVNAPDAGSALKERLSASRHDLGTHGHYNQTVQRGDGHNFRLLPLIALAVAFALAVVWVLQQVGG